MSNYDFDYLIIGSGFGGSVSAHRLAEKGYSVAVMEMGKRWRAEDFPESNWNARRFYWRPRLGLKGFFNLRPFRHVMVICGNAVGGGSITYANTLLVPPDSIWGEGTWAGLSDWTEEMPAHFAEAERMLGVTENELFGPADNLLKEMAELEGVGDTFKPTRVATFFPAKGESGGETHPDPYFGGVGIRFPGKEVDMSPGVAIGSGIHIDKHTHIEATRYGNGHDLNSTLTALMVGGEGPMRILHWLWALLRHPVTFCRAANPFGWARQSLIFLVMQTVDASLSMRLKRRWYWPFSRLLCSEGNRIPTNIPQANEFTRKMAAHFNGIPFTTATEIFFNVPFTAHCMGGCAMADSPEHGVIDSQNRVFNYQNLYVIDGSMLGANLGVNPSLTITALAERAMSFIPPKEDSRNGNG